MNKLRGEVSLDNGHTLRYTVNSLCALEQVLRMPIQEKMKQAADAGFISVVDLRTFFWAGLLHSQPEITMGGAGEIMDTVGVARAEEAIVEALNLSNPSMGKGAVVVENPPVENGPKSS